MYRTAVIFHKIHLKCIENVVLSLGRNCYCNIVGTRLPKYRAYRLIILNYFKVIQQGD